MAQWVKNSELSLQQHGFTPWPGTVGWGSGTATAMAKVEAAPQIQSLVQKLPHAMDEAKKKKKKKKGSNHVQVT